MNKLIIFLSFFCFGLVGCEFKAEVKQMTPSEKADWMESCNKMKNSFDHIKMNTVNRCLGACDKVVNAKVKVVKVREENFRRCIEECQKAKVDIFEDVFFIERKIDEKLNCHYRY